MSTAENDRTAVDAETGEVADTTAAETPVGTVETTPEAPGSEAPDSVETSDKDESIDVEAIDDEATDGEATDGESPIEDAAVETDSSTEDVTPDDVDAPAEDEPAADAATDAETADEETVCVAARVRVTLDDGSTREGEIVDDFADLAPGDTTVEARIDAEHTARLRRWAISTDDHDIVFADDDAVELISV
ncbi:hypothetical protein [Gordonia jinghuaiqii]|uniref:hypothetical protein n=1 Tax=Gordonia jinghuaiqii TaxID=2758710 RepID=UPI001FD21540|nr:hypothetical protein [Gordonia jinghuaiqii]